MHVNFGTPIQLDDWLTEHPEIQKRNSNPAVFRTGSDARDWQATAKRINLVASVILTANNQVMVGVSRSINCDAINSQRSWRCCASDKPDHTTVTNRRNRGDLGWLDRESHAYGDLLALKSINAVMLTWYRNNILHLLALLPADRVFAGQSTTRR